MAGLQVSSLRKARFEKGLTQYGLMIKTGIFQSRLSLIENGYHTPTKREAKRIAKVLGMSVEQLFPNIPNNGAKR